ncbi:hypothetical protein N7451_012144 [Penicillium sp. IBT 35674x]|nr:hypothetical protein N7451_012144 [Penicillium sp. IBT 35674x]
MAFIEKYEYPAERICAGSIDASLCDSTPVTTDDPWVLAEHRLRQDKFKQSLFQKPTLILQKSGLVIGRDGGRWPRKGACTSLEGPESQMTG